MGLADILGFKKEDKANIPPHSDLMGRSKAFCMAPWVEQHVAVHGEIFPCCLSAEHIPEALGDMKKGDTLATTWNNERSKDLRLNMLGDKKSKLCDLCYRYEDLGKESPRQQINHEFKHRFNEVKQTKPDGSLPEHKPSYLDIRLSNLCNFKCRICSHYFSSKWYDDAKAMGMMNDEFSRMVYPTDDLDGFWDHLEPMLSSIEKIHFAGGEPLIIENHYRILQYLIDNNLTDVRLSYNTNFSDFKFKGHDAIEMWKHFKTIYLCASLDGSGSRGEYMRKGQRWDKVEQERKRMLTECPHISFELTPTISIMNVWHFPDFYQEWVEKGLMQPHEMNIYLLFNPDYYNIQRLPKAVKATVKSKYTSFINGFISSLGKDGEKAKGHFEYITRHMEERDLPMKKEFFDYNKKLDGVRGESFEKVFPELVELFET